MDLPNGGYRHIPEVTVSRLPVYLRSLLEFSERGVQTVSSETLATATNVKAAKVRKDLSYMGSYGTRGVGYGVAQLIGQIRDRLGLNHDWNVGIAGAGNLGRALVNYKGFGERKVSISAVFDNDEAKVGERVAGIEIQHADTIEAAVRENDLHIGIVATPAAVAQNVTDSFVAGGIQGILNFAPMVLQVPDGVMIRKVDLSIELQILGFYMGRGSAVPEPVEAAE